jgi:hypothetical protein
VYVEACVEYCGVKDQHTALEYTHTTISKASKERERQRARAKGTSQQHRRMATVAAAATLPTEITRAEGARHSMGRDGHIMGDTYQGRYSHNISASNEIETAGVEDLGVTMKKLQAVEQKLKTLAEDVKDKTQKVAEADFDLNECRLRWDLMHAQLRQLAEQLSSDSFKLHQDVGNQLQRASCLSIDMYNLP